MMIADAKPQLQMTMGNIQKVANRQTQKQAIKHNGVTTAPKRYPAASQDIANQAMPKETVHPLHKVIILWQPQKNVPHVQLGQRPTAQEKQKQPIAQWYAGQRLLLQTLQSFVISMDAFLYHQQAALKTHIFIILVIKTNLSVQSRNRWLQFRHL